MTQVKQRLETPVSHFYKISKHLVDKPSLFANKETSFLCFSDNQYWHKFYVLTVCPSGATLHFRYQVYPLLTQR